jgi:membrane protease YdiL (CAAX protease family)
MAWIPLIIAYAIHILPPVTLTLLFLNLLPKRCVEFRIMMFIVTFVLIRDTMTPFGLWRLGSTNGVLWLEFIESPEILFILSIGSLLLIGLFRFMDPDIFNLVIFFTKRNVLENILVGLTGALILLGTILIGRLLLIENPHLYYSNSRPPRPLVLHIAMLTLSMTGNLFEEVLFRGLLQGYFETIDSIPPRRAALLSGLAFGVFHIFLASSVTQLGISVLFFTLLEGFVCSLVRLRSGVIASTITHGLTIYGIASGVV